VWNTPIAVTCLQPGYIESDMTARATRTMLMTEAERGHRLLVKAVEREPVSAFVPSWPWSVLARIITFVPASLARRAS
jgi:NAD(P)-dependent dehydrogenase (short-subunit alcohol dehydrogenase family)